jgi:hypothetical protein
MIAWLKRLFRREREAPPPQSKPVRLEPQVFYADGKVAIRYVPVND